MWQMCVLKRVYLAWSFHQSKLGSELCRNLLHSGVLGVARVLSGSARPLTIFLGDDTVCRSRADQAICQRGRFWFSRLHVVGEVVHDVFSETSWRVSRRDGILTIAHILGGNIMNTVAELSKMISSKYFVLSLLENWARIEASEAYCTTTSWLEDWRGLYLVGNAHSERLTSLLQISIWRQCAVQGPLLLILSVGSLLLKCSNFQQIHKKLTQFDKKLRSDEVESRLKPNPTQGPKAKMTSNNQLSNW